MGLSYISPFINPLWASSHKPIEFLQSIQGKPNEGELIYRHFCVNCHAEKPWIPLGAPRLHHPEEWKPRLPKTSKGFNRLLQNTFEGVGAMPARGGCFECSDAQLKKAVLYLLNNVAS
ncbi:MAG: c-type cytochrome [Legionellaceae bacterium]|nr:c-type cytochrome [Legionellaceae bacterium]